MSNFFRQGDAATPNRSPIEARAARPAAITDRFLASVPGVHHIGTSAANMLVGTMGGADWLEGRGGDDTLVGFEGNDTLSGGAGDDILGGGEDADRLSGGSGNDKLFGQAGADTLIGGTGDDSYEVDDVGDTIIESAAADGGLDDVIASVSYKLSPHVEKLMLHGDALDGTGNSSDNALYGTEAANHLRGLAGNDSLYGGAGADTLSGGAGDDQYWVDDLGDVVHEIAGPAGGTDTVYSSVDFKLGAHVDNLLLLGMDNLRGTGNSGDNILFGNFGANLLKGGPGNDSLSSNGGHDTLDGGTGNDTYFVEAGDRIIERSADSSEIDTVFTFDSWSLGAHLENLVLFGSEALTARGNALDNSLTGGSGDNRMLGRDGNDTLDGNAGNDSLNGGRGNDVLRGNSGTDTLTGGTGDDVFVFGGWDELGLAATRDRITDFSRKHDRIDLHFIDADAAQDGDQAFSFVSAAQFGTAAGQLSYANGIVSINADVDADAEYQIELVGKVPTALSAADFVL